MIGIHKYIQNLDIINQEWPERLRKKWKNQMKVFNKYKNTANMKRYSDILQIQGNKLYHLGKKRYLKITLKLNSVDGQR